MLAHLGTRKISKQSPQDMAKRILIENLKSQFGLELKISKEQSDGQEVENGQKILTATPAKLDQSAYITATNTFLDAIANNNMAALDDELHNPTLRTTDTPKKTTKEEKSKTALAISNNKYGLHPLVFAIVNKNKEAALKIIESYKSIDDKVYPQYLLALAIKMFDDSEVALALIDKGITHNEAKDFNAFYFAAEKGWVDVLKAIPESSQAWKIDSTNNKNALNRAIEKGNKEFVKVIIDKKLISRIITDECTLMISKGWLDLIEDSISNDCVKLAMRSIETNLKDAPNPNQLLKILIKVGSTNVANIIGSLSSSDSLYAHIFYDLASPNGIEQNALNQILGFYKEKLLNKQDIKGQTSLHIAVQENNEQAVKKLLEFGADVRILDKRELSALDYADEKGRESIKQILQQHIIDKSIEMPVAEKQKAALEEAMEASEARKAEIPLEEEQSQEETPEQKEAMERQETLNSVIQAEEAERQRRIEEQKVIFERDTEAFDRIILDETTEKQSRIGDENEYYRGGLGIVNNRQPQHTGGAENRDQEEQSHEEEAERQRLATEKKEAAKQARTSKCNAFGGVFSVISAGGMYAIYANQEMVLSVLSPLATPVLEHAYFTAAHTAIANTGLGNVIISFVIENSQECMIAAASLAIIASLVTSYTLGYKLADVALAEPAAQV